MIAQNGPDCPSAVCIGPGGSFTSGSLTVSSNAFYSSITINNKETLTVKSGFTLYVGQVGTAATTQVVDFQNGCTVVIEPGASLVVNGLLNNSNNSNGVKFDGSVVVTGNVTAGNGSTIGGGGTLETTGSISTGGSGSVFESTGDCGSGPCSGSTLNCPSATNTISGNQTICSGNTPTVLIGSNKDSGAAYQWQQSTTFGANFINISTATQSSYTPGSLSTTTYYRRIEIFSGCVGTSSQVAVVVVAAPIPTGSSNQAFCLGATVANLAATGTAIKWYDISTGGIALPITSALVDGKKYYATQTISGCESASRFAVTVTVNSSSTPATKTWNGTGWLPAGAPTADQNIEFKGNYNVVADVIACSCTVTSGTVTISAGNNLILGDKLTVSGTGKLTFEDRASLVQINNNAINIGNISYKRLTTTQIDNFDYTYWSSPVSPQKLIDVSPKTSLDKFYSFNLTTNDWQQEDPNTKNMTSGLGYIIRGPQTYVAPAPPNFYEAPFKGVPNNGVVTVTIPSTVVALEASALLGNPYPSALNADLFLISNMTTALEGTLYFWTHNTNIGAGTANLGSGAYAYTSDDYATYNLTGGAATGIGTVAAGINNSIPNGKIASGQAFFAGVKPSGGTVTFNNSMRLTATGTVLDNSQFFKLNNTKSKMTGSIEKDRIWINLFNSQGAFKQILVGYITGATNEYDNGYDGDTFDGNEFVDFYSVNQDRNLVIQGRALPFDEADEVPIGYKSTIAGDFTIAIAQTDGLLDAKDIFIEDKSTQAVRNLKEGAYKFTTEAGTFNDRFVLRYTNKTLGNENFEKPENSVLVSNKNKQIKINSSVEIIDKIQIFDLLGRSIYQKMNVNTSEFVISNLVSNHQALLVKVMLRNGQTITKKIIY